MEQMARNAERYKRRHGSAASIRLQSDRSLPPANATPEQLRHFHEQHTTGRGGYNPLDLIR